MGNLNGSKVAALCREKNGKRKRPRRFLCNPAIRAQEALEILCSAFEVGPRKNDFSSVHLVDTRVINELKVKSKSIIFLVKM